MGESASLKSFEIIKAVRSCGLIAETDVVGRGLRAQMKYADNCLLYTSSSILVRVTKQLAGVVE